MARFNLGRMLMYGGAPEAAAACFEAVLRLAPGDAQAHLALGGLRLLHGDFARGWPAMRRGHDLGHAKALPGQLQAPPATWHGETIGDGVLVVYADQGFGDAIQFCRYLPLCAERARVQVVAPPGLKRLLQTLPGDIQIVAAPPAAGGYVHCPMTLLPHVFGTTLATIPGPSPYLQADAAAVAVWRGRLADLPGRKVGLVWAGNTSYLADRNRSVALESLAALGDIPGISLVSLQKGDAAGQIRAPRPPMALYDATDSLTDFADTAALVAALDLVIGVDTAVVHLAGALGRPVWLLNRFDTDWRWLLDRADSPWYPSLRQFRQSQPRDWAGVIAAVGVALHRFGAA